MELRVLRYFVTVAREETISRAAEILHITQPTLSRQLAQMEYDLGTTLLEHRGRRVVLTPDGLLLRRRAEEILELVEKTEQEMGRSGEELQGTIVAGHGEIAAMSQLADCAAAFQQEHPQVRFSFFSGAADVVKERMDRGLIDVGLLMEPIELEKYDYIRMGTTEKMAAFLRPEDPLAQKESISPEDLAEKPLILPNRYQNLVQNWMGPLFQEENVRFLTSLPAMGGILSSRGHGYMLSIEDAFPFRDPDKLTVRPLKGCEEIHSVLAWRRGQPASPAVERFLAFAKCFLGIEPAT